jgi:4-carboxymuconolactone decarboxylase
VDEAVRAVVALSAALGAGARIEAALDRAAAEADALAVEEALLQSYLFLGYPAALNAIALWRERAPRPAAAPAADDWATWVGRGERVCRRVYGTQYGPLRASIARLHPDLDRWMVAEGYGKVLGRPGLDLAVRELCIVALLAGLDAPRQLYAHMRGALNAGVAPGDVGEALDLAAQAVPARAAQARQVWASLLRRRERGMESEANGSGGAADVR